MNKKGDSLILGVFLGIVVPAILFLIFNAFLESKGGYITPSINAKFQLVLIAINAVMMRMLFVNFDKEKTGRGVFLVTLVGVIAHAIIYW